MNTFYKAPHLGSKSDDSDTFFTRTAQSREQKEKGPSSVDDEIAKVRGVFENERMQHPGDTRLVRIDLVDGKVVPLNDDRIGAFRYAVPKELFDVPGLTIEHFRYFSVLYKNMQDARALSESPDITWDKVRDRLLENRSALDLLSKTHSSFFPRFVHPQSGQIRFDEMDVFERRKKPQDHEDGEQDFHSILEAQGSAPDFSYVVERMEPSVYLDLIARGKKMEAEYTAKHPKQPWDVSFHKTQAVWLKPDDSLAGREAAKRGYTATLGSNGAVRHINPTSPSMKDAPFQALHSMWI